MRWEPWEQAALVATPEQRAQKCLGTLGTWEHHRGQAHGVAVVSVVCGWPGPIIWRYPALG